MLSALDLERLITAKRREIQKEKTVLGLSALRSDVSNIPPEDDKENSTAKPKKQVNFIETKVLGDHNANSENKGKCDEDTVNEEREESIPPDLERYIRRYTGLPVMLKAGEYSPNNPLIRGERASGDALLGLGEYERRRNTLRKLRQQQYREYLDQQAKLKQEAKEKAEIERREREQRDREHEEREREREEREREREKLERERRYPEKRRASMCYVSTPSSGGQNNNKVDACVQVDGISRPLSVAVQTDDVELFRLSPSPLKGQLTEAERELSPHTVVDPYEEKTAKLQWGDEKWKVGEGEKRRRSYADFNDHSTPPIKRTSRDKLVSDLRHTYMPSIFDADAIQRRNLQVEKEAATKRQYYQQELKNQILEQQRIREERKTREKMLEQAEMRRLEEQLRMLRVAQEKEVHKHHDINNAMKDNATDYEKKRTALQKQIDFEQQSLIRTTSQPSRVIQKRQTHTSQSDNIQNPSKLPFYYPRVQEKLNETTNQSKRQPFSINIPENSIFSPNYDVESYLRRNLNPSKESFLSNRLDNAEQLNNNRNIQNVGNVDRNYLDYDDTNQSNIVVERALVHEHPRERKSKEKVKKESGKKNSMKEIADDSLPIPVLRHSPKTQTGLEEENSTNLSDAMKVVDDKWKIPAVQKNILKSLPNEEGKSVSILTQLGSIRRQLQLEQLKLDKMSKDNDV